MDSSRNQIIEVLRFLAAAAIVVVHLPTMGWPYASLGVDMFFIISGFVMMLSTTKNHDQFFLKRLIRIVPIYWVLTIVIFIVALLAPEVLNNTSGSVADLMKSLLFIPFDKNGAGHFPILFVGWTLNYEMFFYAAFAAALYLNFKNRDLVVGFIFLGLVVLLQKQDAFLLQVYSDPIILEFVLGFALFEVLGQRRPGRLLLFVLIYSAPLILTDIEISHRAYKFGAPCFVMALLALHFFRAVKFPKTIVTLGGASYALYLSHPYVIQFCDKVLNIFDHGLMGRIITTLIVFAVTCVIAILIYKVFEHPVTQSLRTRLISRDKI
jgi:peptidoglycan/LPS O-acetylase OafA/YrhL